jgi:hypothetical protein
MAWLRGLPSHIRKKGCQGGRSEAHGRGERVRGTDVPSRHDGRSDERPDEQADAEGSAQRGECTSAHWYRDGLGEVRLARQVEDGAGHTRDCDGNSEQQHRLCEECT